MNLKPNAVVDSPGIRVLIWTYFVLLMFEGVLRKWVLPGYSDMLLVVREPFLLMIYLLAFSRGIFPFNGYVVSLLTIGSVSAATGLSVGSQNLMVTAYGFDAMFFHLPLIFVIPKVMTRADVLKFGRWILLLTFPMAALMVIQFRSPPDALVNCGASGGVGAQIGSALGKIRPPGFFTFITGAAQFLALASVFFIFGLWKKGIYPRFLLIAAGIAVGIAAVVSSSRLALGSIGTVLVMVGVILMYDRKGVSNALGMLIPLGLILVVVTNLDVFDEGRQVFEARLHETGDLKTGVVRTASNWTIRVFGDVYGGMLAIQNAPFFGAGLGVGTNVGARLLSGSLGFLLAEGEWARVVLELGPLLALPYLLIRVLICGTLYSMSARSARAGNGLPMLLFGGCALLVLIGQFSQASTLGFAVLGSGFCLAATNLDGSRNLQGEESAVESQFREVKVSKPRGRSRYAETLHDSRPCGNG